MGIPMITGWSNEREDFVKLWVRDSGFVTAEEASTKDMALTRFLAEVEGEAITVVDTYTGAFRLQEITDALREVMTTSDPATSNEITTLYVTGVVGLDPVLAIVESQRGDDEDWDDHKASLGFSKAPKVKRISVSLTGHRKAIATLFTALHKKFFLGQVAVIKWWSQGSHGPTVKSIYMDPLKTSLHSEFYPDLKCSAEDYIRSFLESDAAVLLMCGPPGTGKTTLLRHMICDFKLAAHVVYDEALMKSDAVFQNFLFEAESDVLIIEDADTILADRERENNKLMARFLNVSDGLIKLPNKKVIFTTNIGDFNKVDPALLRPGRCFDVLHTRALNLTEAQAAAKKANLAIPTEKREYTLAELFNQRQAASVRRVGFSGRG